MQDTLSDMLVRIKNAQSARKQHVVALDSKFNRSICEVLVSEGYINQYDIKHIDNKPFINITLKYYLDKPVIDKITRVSKSSLRVYTKCQDIPNNIYGFGVMVISTPKGVMSHLKAKSANLGGEVLFTIN